MPPQKNAAFNVEGARKAGYSDDEILAHLTQSRKFDVQGALKSGYSKSDLIGYLSSTPAQTENPMSLPGGTPRLMEAAQRMNLPSARMSDDEMRSNEKAKPYQRVQSVARVGATALGGRGVGATPDDWSETARQVRAVPDAVKQGAKNVVGGVASMAQFASPTTLAPAIADMAAQSSDLWNKSNQVPQGPGSNVEKYGYRAAALTPGIGPWAAQKGEQVGQGDVLPAAAEVGSTFGLPHAIGPALSVAKSIVPDVPLTLQNEYAQKGIGPTEGHQQHFQRDLEGARPYLGGKGISSQEDLQGAIPGAKNEVWQPYNDAMQRIGNQQVQGPNGPTTYAELEARRKEVSAQLNAVRSKDPAALQTIMQQNKTPADLEAEDAAIKGVLDPALQAQGINPLAIRNTAGSLKGIERQVSGSNTMTEKTKPYGFGRAWGNIDLAKPSTWTGAITGAAEDLFMRRPLWSGKPTDVDIKTGLLSGADKPSFANVTSPQPAGPQVPSGNSALYGAQPPTLQGPGGAPPPVPPQYAVTGIGRPTNAGGSIPTQNRAVNAQVTQLPTQHPGNGDYAGLLPGPPAPFVPPAPGPDLPQVGGLPTLGHPVITPDPMWTGEARPGIVPTRGPAAGDESGSMLTSGWPNVKPTPSAAPSSPIPQPPTPQPAPSLTLPAGNPYSLNDIPAQPVNPQEVNDLQQETPQLMSSDRVNQYLRERAIGQNIKQGLGGNRRDLTGETREAHRSKLESKGKGQKR